MNESESKLSEREERLLISYHDGECNLLNVFLARRLLKRSAQANEFILNLKNLGVSMRADRASSPHASTEVDLWSRISARIDSEERAELMLGERSFRKARARAESGWEMWWPRLSWGASGAAFAAACSAILVYSGTVGPASSPSRMASLNSARSQIPLVAPVAFSGQGRAAAESGVSPLEMDWMRSEGRLHVMHDPEEKTSIIWVKPRQSRNRTPQATLAGDFNNQRLSRPYSRSNTHIPVAIPVSGR